MCNHPNRRNEEILEDDRTAYMRNQGEEVGRHETVLGPPLRPEGKGTEGGAPSTPLIA